MWPTLRSWLSRRVPRACAQTAPDTRVAGSVDIQTSTVQVPATAGARTVAERCDSEARLQAALAGLDAVMSSTAAASSAAIAATQIGGQP